MAQSVLVKKKDSDITRLRNGDLVVVEKKKYLVCSFVNPLEPKTHADCSLMNLKSGSKLSNQAIPRRITKKALAGWMNRTHFHRQIKSSDITIIPKHAYTVTVEVSKMHKVL